MGWDAWVDLAEVIAGIGVVISLVFVGYQYRQTSDLLERGEQNATMAEWSTIRMAIIGNRDVAALWHTLESGEPLDAVDSLRLDTLLEEHLWAGYHIWDRTRRSLFSHGRFEETAGLTVGALVVSERANAWWAEKKAHFPPPYVASVDSVVAGLRAAHPHRQEVAP